MFVEGDVDTRIVIVFTFGTMKIVAYHKIFIKWAPVALVTSKNVLFAPHFLFLNGNVRKIHRT